MNRVRVVFKPGALSTLRKSPGVVADLGARAGRIAEACNSSYDGNGYASDVDVESNRAGAAVFTTSAQSSRDNLEHNTLIRNIDAGR